MAHPLPDELAERPPARRPWGCLFAALLMAFCVYLIKEAFWPSDWVDVTVGPLPAGHVGYCLVAEDSRGVHALPWYHAKISTDLEPPFLGGELGGSNWDGDGDGFIEQAVRWRGAGRIGVLIRFADGRWQLRWPGPGAITRPSAMRYVAGGGRAAIRLDAEGETVTPSAELLRRLGSREPGSP